MFLLTICIITSLFLIVFGTLINANDNWQSFVLFKVVPVTLGVLLSLAYVVSV